MEALRVDAELAVPPLQLWAWFTVRTQNPVWSLAEGLEHITSLDDCLAGMLEGNVLDRISHLWLLENRDHFSAPPLRVIQ